ncbi:hypothetical protein CFK39_15705 (plasmid) [Brachybacterium avium]|uniref:Uncharacterized protein n=1 Tax=Brachybacterium avium TaxID=2017485 RepID=A0A220UGI0_9MICO|nr:hypothetical protein [Brachybacterium avium]ASK67288.1 hypothetical protein CFK39_15705 [Brachybacterium avium]
MNDLIIQAAGVIQTDGTLQAAGFFDQINTFAGLAEETAKVFFGAGFIVGAAIQWVKNKFSVASGIAGIFLAVIGGAILAQMDMFQQSAEDTIPDAAPVVNESTLLEAQPQLEDPIVLTVDDLGYAA